MEEVKYAYDVPVTVATTELATVVVYRTTSVYCVYNYDFVFADFYVFQK